MYSNPSKLNRLQTPLQTVLQAQADVEALARRLLDVEQWDTYIEIEGRRFDRERVAAWMRSGVLA